MNVASPSFEGCQGSGESMPSGTEPSSKPCGAGLDNSTMEPTAAPSPAALQVPGVGARGGSSFGSLGGPGVSAISEELILKRGTTLVRRQRLEPGEDTGWHRDPHHRVTVVLQGDELAIEFPDSNTRERFSVRPGQVDWDEPLDRAHRGVNVGQLTYEEVAIFFLEDEEADPQPRVNVDDP